APHQSPPCARGRLHPSRRPAALRNSQKPLPLPPLRFGGGRGEGEGTHQLPSTSRVSRPRLSSETEALSPHSAQRMSPCANSVEKIMSSKVSPSPSAYHGPSPAMRSSTSAAGVSGSAAKRQEQRRQYNSTCMADLPSGSFISAGPRLRGGEGRTTFDRQTCDGSRV